MSRDELFISVMSLAEVPRDYRGMDGLVLKCASDRQTFEEEYRTAGLIGNASLSPYNPLSLRHLNAVDLDGHASAGDVGRWLGWDVGHLSADSTYSLIIHYLRNNRPRPSTDYALNDNLLFESPLEAIRLLNEWREWSPDNPHSKETFIEGDELGVWAISDLVPSEADLPAFWTAWHT